MSTHTHAESTADAAENPPLQYQTVAEFVEDYIASVYNRPATQHGTHWCPMWWYHAEAVEIFMGLWQSWEHMRVNDGPCWLVKWKTYYFYSLMREVTGPEGPFYGCSPREGHAEPEHPDGMPVEAAPVDVFTPRRGLHPPAPPAAGTGDRHMCCFCVRECASMLLGRRPSVEGAFDGAVALWAGSCSARSPATAALTTWGSCPLAR